MSVENVEMEKVQYLDTQSLMDKVEMQHQCGAFY